MAKLDEIEGRLREVEKIIGNGLSSDMKETKDRVKYIERLLIGTMVTITLATGGLFIQQKIAYDGLKVHMEVQYGQEISE